MARESIGNCRCPLCRSVKARVGVSNSGLAYVTCNACNSQVFARSERSDSYVRELIVTPATTPEPVPNNPPRANADAVPANEGTGETPAPGQRETPSKVRNKWEVF